MSVKDSEQTSLAAVQVAVRIRPLSDKDRSQPRFAHATNDDVLQAHENNTVVISPPHNKIFTFDHVFGPQTQQAEIFAALGEKSIRKFVEGYNVTMLAYGQTSSGKTYTVGTAHHTGHYNPEQEGIVPRAMALLFDLLHQNDTRPTSPTTSLSTSSSIDGSTSSTKGRLRPVSRISYSSFNNNNNNNSSSSTSASNNTNTNTKSKYKYTVKVSFVEIYNEELIDLLNFAPPNERPPVTIREDTKGQIYWTGVKEMNVSNTDDVLMYLQQGTQNRATGATDMNEQSSRSHAIFSVTLRQEKWTPTASNSNSHTPRTSSPTSPRSKPRPLSAMNLRINDGLTSNDDAGEWIITTSKLHFVDLAGSERLKRTAAEGDRRKEGININGGLLALGNVISALGDASKKSTHIPYRDSKLTRLLQDSLGGSAMTLMIACVSPMEYNISETLNTLQYANRARNIKNRMEKNEVEEWLTTDNVDLLRSMITKLKTELRNRSSSSSSSPPPSQQQQQKGDHRLSVSPIPRHMYADGAGGDVTYQEQQQANLMADLQRQMERNHAMENEIRMMKSVMEQHNNSNWQQQQQVFGGSNFEHAVQPVVEEYEIGMAKLESQLSMTRAALTHSDIRIDELQVLTQTQEDIISDLKAKLNKYKDEERRSQGYIEELEAKLLHSANDAVQDEEMLNELKNRIMKFKELDDSTELYILDLEKQLANNETNYTNKLAQHQQTIAKQNEHIEQLEHDLKNMQLGSLPPPSSNSKEEQDSHAIEHHLKERQALQQHIAKLEHDLMNVTTQLQQQQQNGLVSPALVESDGAMEEHHRHQRLVMSPPPPSAMDPEHEKRKRMFSGGTPRPSNHHSTLLQSTLASLDNVQSDYVALKERYKHWAETSQQQQHQTTTTATTTTSMLGDDDSPLPQGGLAPTMSTGSSLSSLDSIGTVTGNNNNNNDSTIDDEDERTMVDIQRKCDDVVKQYQNQLQRIQGAIQRLEKLEQTTTTTTTVLPMSPTSPSPSPSPPPQQQQQHDALLDLAQQFKDRQHSLQDAWTRFEIEMKGDLAALKQLHTLQHVPKTSTSTSTSTSSHHANDEKTQQRLLMDQIMQRLSNAAQDVELHRSKTFVLQTKLQKLEVAFRAQQQRKSSASEDQDGIEQLMKKMDAIKIQLESRDIKSISVKE